MMSDSLLTKYRPTTFEQVIGHDTVIANFKAAAQVSRVFLFSGPSGVGKTTLARLGAQHVGASIREVDAATLNGVDEMRELTESLNYSPLVGDAAAVIIDECHRITPQGWTVLLKPLEELPRGVFVLFCTTDLARVPDTIQTRCTVFHLQPVSTNDLIDYLGAIVDEESWPTPSPVIALCAQYGLGSPRRALALLTACGHCDSREEAAKAINAAVTGDNLEGLGFRLAQALVTPNWQTITGVLKKIEEAGESPEGVRQVVRAYFKTVVLGSKSEKVLLYPAKVLLAFNDPITDMPSLVLAVCGALIGN